MTTIISGSEAIEMHRSAAAHGVDVPLRVRGEVVTADEAEAALAEGALRPEDIEMEIPAVPAATPDTSISAGPVGSGGGIGAFRAQLPVTRVTGTDAAGNRWEQTINSNYPPGHARSVTYRRLS